MNSAAVLKRYHVGHAAMGLLLGYGLSRMGFTDFDQVHAMFTFADLRLFLTFVAGLALTMVGLRVFARGVQGTERPLHPGVVPGAFLFGLGWAVCGVCPGVVMVQLGEGKPYALLTLAGILAGNSLYGAVHARYFRWNVGGCEVA